MIILEPKLSEQLDRVVNLLEIYIKSAPELEQHKTEQEKVCDCKACTQQKTIERNRVCDEIIRYIFETGQPGTERPTIFLWPLIDEIRQIRDRK